MVSDLLTILGAFVLASLLAGALGGRHAALELLAAQDPGLDVAALTAILEQSSNA